MRIIKQKDYCRNVLVRRPHLSAMLLAVCRKRAWSVSFRVWSAWVMRDDDLSKNCLQLAICWASFLKRTTCRQTQVHKHNSRQQTPQKSRLQTKFTFLYFHMLSTAHYDFNCAKHKTLVNEIHYDWSISS